MVKDPKPGDVVYVNSLGKERRATVVAPLIKNLTMIEVSFEDEGRDVPRTCPFDWSNDEMSSEPAPKTYTQYELDAICALKVSQIANRYDEVISQLRETWPARFDRADKHEEITEDQRAWFRELAKKVLAFNIDPDLGPGIGRDGKVYYTRTPVAVQVALNLQAKIDALQAQVNDMRSELGFA